MANPLKFIRKYQGVILAVSGTILMVVFVIGPVLQQMPNQGGPGGDGIVFRTRFGNLTYEDIRRRVWRRNLVQALEVRLITVADPILEQPESRQELGQRVTARFPTYAPNPDVRDEMVLTVFLLEKFADQLGVEVTREAAKQYIADRSRGNFQTEELNQFAQNTRRLEGNRAGTLPREVLDALAEELRVAEMARVLGLSPPWVIDADLEVSLQRRQMFARMAEQQESIQQQRQLLASARAPMTPAQKYELVQRLQTQLTTQAIPISVEKLAARIEAPESEDSLRVFFEDRKDQLASPERGIIGFLRPFRMSFTYLKADFDKYVEAALITPEQVEEYYKSNRDQFRDEPLPTQPGQTPGPFTPEQETPPGTPPETTPPETNPPETKPPETKPGEDVEISPKPMPARPGTSADSSQPPVEQTAPDDQTAPDGAAASKDSAQEPQKPETSGDADDSEGSQQVQPVDESSALPAGRVFSAGVASVVLPGLLLQADETRETDPSAENAAQGSTDSATGKQSDEQSSLLPPADLKTPMSTQPGSQAPGTPPVFPPTAIQPPAIQPPDFPPPDFPPPDPLAPPGVETLVTVPDGPMSLQPGAHAEQLPRQAEETDIVFSVEPIETQTLVLPSPYLPEIRYKSLEVVQGDIRRILAAKTFESDTQEAFRKVQKSIRRYGKDYEVWLSRLKENEDNPDEVGPPPEMPAEALDEVRALSWIELVETGLVSRRQALLDRILGSMMLSDGQTRFPAFAFARSEQQETDLSFFAPQETEILPSNQIVGGKPVSDRALIWKTDQRRRETPTFDEIRDEVLAAWKTQQARQQALRLAEQLLKIAREADSLEEVLQGEGGELLQEALGEDAPQELTPQATFPSLQANPFTGVSTSVVEGIEDAGGTFMADVFRLQQAGDIGIAGNTPQTFKYVVKLLKRVDPPAEALQRPQPPPGLTRLSLDLLTAREQALVQQLRVLAEVQRVRPQ